ncbi:MAG: hypothetical protein CMF22_11655 [Idiomarinaceae bacterium]|nr:hypothetical protein [Idiomarinaceae bacterium]|tara:strand:+ start:357 stop:599 length:243 start_codon:yes stop_codon:yes gene_type:complete
MSNNVPEWLIEETKAEMAASFVLTEGITDEDFRIEWEVKNRPDGSVGLYMRGVVGETVISQVRSLQPIIERTEEENQLNG